MKRLLAGVLLACTAPTASGCVMAARQVVKQMNRSQADDALRKQFPAGTPEAKVNVQMTGSGYACLLTPKAEAAEQRLDCHLVQSDRSAATFLFGGNWKIDFGFKDGLLTTVHAASRARRSEAG